MSKPIRDSLPTPPTPGGNNLNNIPDTDSDRVAPTQADESSVRKDLDHPDAAGKLPTPL